MRLLNKVENPKCLIDQFCLTQVCLVFSEMLTMASEVECDNSILRLKFLGKCCERHRRVPGSMKTHNQVTACSRSVNRYRIIYLNHGVKKVTPGQWRILLLQLAETCSWFAAYRGCMRNNNRYLRLLHCELGHPVDIKGFKLTAGQHLCFLLRRILLLLASIRLKC